MFKLNQLNGFNVGGEYYRANALNYSGSESLDNNTLTGGSSSSQGIFYCFFKLDAIGVINRIYFKTAGASSTTFSAWIGTGGEVHFGLSGPSNSFSAQSVGISAGVWHSMIGAWDSNYSAGNKIKQLYVDDVSAINSVIDSGGAFSVNYGDGDNYIGRSNVGQWFNGDLAEIYFAPGQFLDLSVTANRRKFINAGNKPVFLGTDGSLPTGVQPAVYMNQKAITAQVNLGSGGDFDVAGTGDPTDATTSPSEG